MLILAAFLAGTAAFFSFRFFPLVTGLLICLLAGSLWFSFRTLFAERLRTLFVFIISCAAGFFVASAGQSSLSESEMLEGKTLAARGTPITDTVLLDADRNLRAQTFRIGQATDSAGAVHSLRQLRILSDQAFALDRSYNMTIRMPRQIAVYNPGLQGLSLTGYLIAAEERETTLLAPFARARAALHRFFLDQFSSDAGPFLLSIVTGERSYLSRELNQAFSVTGLAHILSISGTHFGLVFFALFHLCRRMILRLPERILRRLTLHLSPSQAGAALALPAVTLYLCISDMSYPAVRSFLMIMLFLLGLLLGRKGVWLNTLLCAALAIVAVDPDAITDLSFQLSFLASLSIGLVSDWLRSRQEMANATDSMNSAAPQTGRARFLAWSKKNVMGSLCISLGATLATTPLVAHHFHFASLIAPGTNLLLTPFIGMLILPVALAGSLLYLITGFFPAAGLLEQITAATLSAVHMCAAIPHASLRLPAWPPIVLVMLFGTLLSIIWMRVLIPLIRGDKTAVLSRSHAAVLAGLLVIACVWSSLHQREGILITFLDVGQGDSAVVETPGNRVIIIDTGRNHLPVGSFLRYRGAYAIDALILSHAHPDHTSGFSSLIRDYQVRELWDNGRLQYGMPIPPETIHRRLERGDLLTMQEYRFTVLHPYREYHAETQSTEENNDSLVLKLEAFGNSVLFTGDIAADAEESMLPLGARLASTILKVPHHGSRTSLSEPFLRSIRPRYAAVSAGRNNSYGHPHPAALQALGSTHIYRTDRDGAVGFHLKPDGSITVKTGKQARLQPASTLEDERKNAERLLTVW